VNAVARDIEDLHAQDSGAFEKWRRTERRIAADPGLPALGDIYAFPVTAEQGIEWGVVKQHSSGDPLWYIVPFDQNPLVGTWDVPVSEFSEAGPGALRCGRGIWAHADDMRIGEKSGFLEPHDVRGARLRLWVMVGGDESLIPICSDVDDDPDYEELMMELARAACRLETALREAAPTT